LATTSAVWSADPTADKTPAAVHKTLTALEDCFSRGDAKGLAALWQPDGDFAGPQGERIAGREKIAAAFQAFFAAHKSCKLQFGVVAMRMVTAEVATVDAIAKMTPAPEGLDGEPRTTIVLVLHDGRWLIDSVRESAGGAPSHYGHLKDLAWMVGDWACKTDGPAGVSVQSSCDWTHTGSFLIRKFSSGDMGGTEVIGWDPRGHRIRSWIFESDGGFGECVWTGEGDHWTVKYKGVLADGNDVSATRVLTRVDDKTQTFASTDRTINGHKRPDIAKITLKRSSVQETKPTEPAKAPQHVLP
jgi:uncharacterized protein (TIGR02246 family)